MGFMSALKSAFASGAKELNKEYGKTNDFLSGVTASCALVIYADGTAEEAEKKKAMDVLTGHTQLASLYPRQAIESALGSALSHAQTASGKQELARQLDAILTLPNGQQMAEDVYLVALDCASANSRHEVGSRSSRPFSVLHSGSLIMKGKAHDRCSTHHTARTGFLHWLLVRGRGNRTRHERAPRQGPRSQAGE